MRESECVLEYLSEYIGPKEKEKIMFARNTIQEHFKMKFDYICIFGAGYRGKKMYYELFERFIEVECFADNNFKKWDYVVEKTYCVPPKCLERNKNNMLVIISLEHGIHEVYEQLRQMGIVNILVEEELLDLLKDIPKALPMGCIDDIDYMTPQNSFLIERFNSVLHDTCKYYEKKIEDIINN
ncbi:MAG: hypothetical protein RR920_01545 [Lachnospiraceae bacterium]